MHNIFYSVKNIYIARMNIGFAVKELRTYARMSQKELAKRSKLTQGYISNVEHGKQQPTTKVIKRICVALGVPVDIIWIMALELKDTKPKLRRAFKQLRPVIDSLVQEILNEIYGRKSR
jgi:transcriptional regulator with XRE-family HTH domain